MSEKKRFVLMGLSILAALACVCPVAFAAVEAGVGVIDTQALLRRHPRYEQTLTQVIEMADRKQKDAGADIDEGSFNRLRDEVAEEEWRLMQPLFDEIEAAIRNVAAVIGLTHVVDKDRLYLGSGTDITEDVVRELIRMNGG